MANQNSNPVTDFFESISQFSQKGWPGFDASSFPTLQQPNFEAMTEIGQIAGNAAQEMFDHQQKIASQMVSDWQEAASNLTTGKSAEMMAKPLESMRENAEKTANAFGELAQIAGKAQSDIAEVVTKSFQGKAEVKGKTE